MRHRVAILGAGVGAAHLEGYLALPRRFEVTQICDREPVRAAALAARCGARVTDEIAAALGDASIDIIDICLPPSLHAPVTLQALAAGKQVICEKPLAGSLVDAGRIAAAARAAGRHVFPVFQYRYGRAFRALDALRAAGLLGAPRVAALETHWNRGADYYATPWRGTWAHELGGATLIHAIHIHDLAARHVGAVRDVSAMLGALVNPVETEDCAALTFRTQDGALVTSSVTLGAAEDATRLRLVYEHLTAESARVPYAPGAASWRFLARDPARQARVDELAAVAPAPEGFAGLFADIANALEAEPNSAPTLDDGIASIELATAIYHAHRSGARVRLPLDRALPICRGLAPVG